MRKLKVHFKFVKYQMQVKQMNSIVVQNMRMYNINCMFKK